MASVCVGTFDVENLFARSRFDGGVDREEAVVRSDEHLGANGGRIFSRAIASKWRSKSGGAVSCSSSTT